MTRFVLAGLAAAIGVAAVTTLATIRMRATPSLDPVAAAGAAPVPVLVELFTSEGCSSCPPADRLLETLATTQPIEGATIIVLSEHVDYWNQLGWRDPFSSADFSARQDSYARVFGRDGLYTPQMVVNGTTGFVGSDAGAAARAIREAARHDAGRVDMVVTAATGPLAATLSVSPVERETFAAALDLFYAVVEDQVTVRVAAGENGGRTLRHAGVVRALKSLGTLSPRDRHAERQIAAAIDPAWRASSLSLVVFAQQRTSRAIAGVARLAPGR